MGGHAEIASWLIGQRRQIESVMIERLGPAAPAAGADESEVLRRFRSFAAAALRRGAAAEPALDGLRVDERRALALLRVWSESAASIAGERGSDVTDALDPLIDRFRTRIRSTGARRRSKGVPRASRRAVMAAIDRVSDAFLAVEADSGRVVDANPAAGALLGLARDALLGVEALSFVPSDEHDLWWTQLDAVCEGSEPRRFRGALRDVAGAAISVDCSITRFAQRGRTLALVLARPL